MKLFVDTWGWLVLADRSEREHRQVTSYYAERTRRTGLIVTSDFVLNELLTILFSRISFEMASRFADSVLRSPFITIERITPERFQKAWELRMKFSDKPRISFTDLTSMSAMNELGITDILTADKHFAQVGMNFRLLPE
nr:PIN domain-containing protein [Candidatus Acidoferrales bacterium]